MPKLSMAVLMASALLTASAANAQASVTIGQAPPSDGSTSVCGATGPNGTDFVQISNATGNPYLVPTGGGVITSWSTSATTGSVAIKLRVYTGTSASFTPVGESATETVTPSSSTPFLTQVPVSGGEHLGYKITTTGYGGCTNTGTPSASDVITGGPAVALGQPLTGGGSQTSALMNISARIEPDADHDGFGDETQDLCPSDASTHGVCPDRTAPETTITKKPKKKTRSKRALLEFSSSEAGSTFECSFDGAAFSGCLSPIVKTLGKGVHVFQVRAVDAAGNADQSPAKAQWKVVRKKHKRKHHHPHHGHG